MKLKVNIKKLHKKRRTCEVVCSFCGKKEIVFKSRAVGYKYCSKDCMRKAYLSIPLPNIGDKINNWEVIQNNVVRKHGRRYVNVRCTCGSGVEKLLPYHHLKNKMSLGCSKCSKHFTNKGYKDISGSFWSSVKHGALKRDIEFNIDIKDAWKLYEKQERRCALSGIDIHFAPSTNKKDAKFQTASLDRIDSSKSYTIENVQWVHKDANIMKNKFTMEYFNKFVLNFAAKSKLHVKIKRLHPDSVIPSYKREGDAGLDLTAVDRYFDIDGNVVYHTGVAIEIPEGYVGLLFPRSSVSRVDLSLCNAVGVIDSNYRGEIIAKFKPTLIYEVHDDSEFEQGKFKYWDRVIAPTREFGELAHMDYEVGERVAQLIIMPYPRVEFQEVEELSKTERGDGGFGSSGK